MKNLLGHLAYRCVFSSAFAVKLLSSVVYHCCLCPRQCLRVPISASPPIVGCDIPHRGVGAPQHRAGKRNEPAPATSPRRGLKNLMVSEKGKLQSTKGLWELDSIQKILFLWLQRYLKGIQQNIDKHQF